MNTTTPPGGLFRSLNVAVFERTSDGSFALLEQAPSWLYYLWPGASAGTRPVCPEDRFLFLEHFFGTATDVWEREDNASVTSEMWTEVDETGHEWLLEAVALQQEGRSLLLLKFPTVAPESYREVLQQSRELSLEHYRLCKEIDRREVLMHCIVHDLSTPLAAVKGSLRMLLDDALILEEGVSLAHIGLRQADKMRRLMSEMLGAFSRRTQTDRTPALQTPPDLAAIVHELITGLTPSALLKGVRFRMETDARTNQWMVVGEAMRLERVFFNLLENALRHAPPGSDILITLHDEGETIRCTVEDAGTGVPDTVVPDLFRKLTQGSGKKGQVGLGLYFCRITIEGCGGSIGYNPSPLGGACFWFRLPKRHSD